MMTIKKVIIKTPCNHVDHLDCILLWVETKQTCPLDSQPIPIKSTE
jgi:hypothetical protein